MKKISLIAHNNDKRKIMKVLTGLGTTEIKKTEAYRGSFFQNYIDNKNEIDKKLLKLSTVFTFLKDADKELINIKKNDKNFVNKGYKLNTSRENLLVEYDDLDAHICRKEYDLFEDIATLAKYSTELTELKAEKTSLENLQSQLKDYLLLDVPFSVIKDYKKFSFICGLIPMQNLSGLSTPKNFFYEIKLNTNNALLNVVCLKEDKENVRKTLSSLEFTICPFSFDATAKTKFDEINARLMAIFDRKKEILLLVEQYFSKVSDFKKLYDYYFLEKQKAEAIENTSSTKKTFILEAWCPSDVTDNTVNQLKESTQNIVIWVEEPKEGEIIPSYTQNNKMVGAFGENITAMFGAPAYGGLDPNPFVAFFYFLFFGFMLSDAGYGLLMSIFCFAYIMIKKPVKNSGSFILMFGLCGISTVLWGAIFGGWFGIEAQYLEQNAFGRFLLTLKQIDPLDGTDALIMFGMALGLGVIQIGTGFFLNGYSKIRQGKILDGVFNDFGWDLIFIGGGIFVVDMFVNSGIVKYIGIAIIALGVLMIMIGGALGKKNPLKMITGALGSLYGSVNVFSDILSYARLFGLGLTTGVIGMVINKIGLLFIDMIPYFGYVIGILVFIIGHLFNFGINALGVYVHNSRLQYVEFFGRFYTGEGHAFNPLGAKTKYLYLSDKLNPKKISTK